VTNRDYMVDVPFFWITNLSNVLEPPQCCESVHCQNVLSLFFHEIFCPLDNKLPSKVQAYIPWSTYHSSFDPVGVSPFCTRQFDWKNCEYRLLLEIWGSLNFIDIIPRCHSHCSMIISVKHPWLVTCKQEMKIAAFVFC
jgi:hypothetical protein